jgi:hypothetical protein
MFAPWYAVANDMIGGWCVVSRHPAPPSTGNIEVASFIDELFAIHIAALHNTWLTEAKKTGTLPPVKPTDAPTQVITRIEPLDQTKEWKINDDHSEYF